MPTDLEHDLRCLGDVMLRSSEPIGPDEIVHAPASRAQPALPPSSTVLHLEDARQQSGRRSRWFVALTAVAASATVGFGLVTIVDRSASPPVGTETVRTDPTASVSPSVDPGVESTSGALIVDPVPAGWALDGAHANPWRGSDAFVTRIYAAVSTRPETRPAFTVQLVDVDAGRPHIPDTAAGVTVQGVGASLYDTPPGRTVSFETAGYWYTVTGYQVSDDQLLNAAEHARRSIDLYGAIIEPAGLPAGTEERSVGTYFETWFVSREVLADPIPTVYWSTTATDDDVSVWTISLGHDAEVAALQRIGAATITDVEVHDAPAFITTDARDSAFRSLSWTNGDRTFLIGSRNVADGDLIDFAEAMRPPADEEWNEILDALRPATADVSPETGLPEPGTVVPTGVQSFPVIDEGLVPDKGRGSTYAYYTYSQPGIEIDGASWIGAVGPAGPLQPADVVGIRVSDFALAEPSIGAPQRDPDVIESTSETTTRLVTTTDGYIVEIVGSDPDALYELIDHVRPNVVDGRLEGYVLTGELPPGLTVVAEPFETGWAAGAFPQAHIHNGALTISVNPAPAITQIASWGTNGERVEVAGRTGYLFDSPDSGVLVLAIELDDGTSLILSSTDLSRNQLVVAAHAVELVDEQTWQDSYDPTPAVIPRIENTSATTEPDAGT